MGGMRTYMYTCIPTQYCNISRLPGPSYPFEVTLLFSLPRMYRPRIEHPVPSCSLSQHVETPMHHRSCPARPNAPSPRTIDWCLAHTLGFVESLKVANPASEDIAPFVRHNRSHFHCPMAAETGIMSPVFVKVARKATRPLRVKYDCCQSA
jgi:hypothetical protein